MNCELFIHLGYTRCGDDSAQCISEDSQCNGVNDCLNGWDEQMSLCLTEDRITTRLVDRKFIDSKHETVQILFYSLYS